MMWIRGNRHDFDYWPEGWSYADMLPYFKRMEESHADASKLDKGLAWTVIVTFGKANPSLQEGLKTRN